MANAGENLKQQLLLDEQALGGQVPTTPRLSTSQPESPDGIPTRPSMAGLRPRSRSGVGGERDSNVRASAGTALGVIAPFEPGVAGGKGFKMMILRVLASVRLGLLVPVAQRLLTGIGLMLLVDCSGMLRPLVPPPHQPDRCWVPQAECGRQEYLDMGQGRQDSSVVHLAHILGLVPRGGHDCGHPQRPVHGL